MSFSKERQFQILQDYEGKLLAVLKKEDVNSLSEDLCIENFISEEIRDKFASLDNVSLKQELMVRYLLLHVYDEIKKDERMFFLFIDVVDKFDRVLAGELTSEVPKYVVAVDSQSDISADIFQTSIGDYKLGENDIPQLTELLIEGSHKWEELGVALLLRRYQIEECRRRSSNQLRLYEVIIQWMGSEKHPTIRKLSNALSSRIFAMNNMASQVEEYYTQMKATTSEQKCAECRPQPIYISGHTEVASGKSALLGFLVTSTMPVRYQWKKDGQVLSDNEVYSGTRSAILFISSDGGQTKGKYNCQVTNGIGKIESRDIHLSLKLNFPKITKNFIKVYTKMDKIPKDSWPPVTNTEFINLALITKNKQTNDNYAYAVHGDADDIITAKERIEYEEVFVKHKNGTLLLIEGRPGSGKTTLVHKVTRDWAIKRNVLIDAEIVVLVPLRLFFFTTNNDITLSSIFERYIESDDERNTFIESIKKKSGEGICFIIDGLDEYDYKNDYTKMIHKLIHKRIFSLAMVIVASRPVGTASVRNKAPVTKRVEVLGFKKEQIMSYIKCYYMEKKEVACKLMSYLNLHINVLHMCYLPVHVAMICFLYSEEGDNLPQTETQIYEVFTRLTLLRKMTRDGTVYVRINFLDSLTGGIKESFSKICRLAYDMTVNSQQVIMQSEATFPLSDTSGSDTPSLGLVTIDSCAKLFGMEDLYTFLHLTYQEYLAAYYIAGLDHKKQIEISEICGYKPHLHKMWKFFCGIVRFEDKEIPKNIMKSIGINTLYKVLCAFESQQKIVCDSVLELENADILSFKDHIVIPTDFLAITYVISTTQYIVTRLSFIDCSLDGDGVSLYLEMMNSIHLNNIKSLSYHKQNCTISEFKNLGILLRKLNCLEILDLEKTEFGVEGMKNLIRSVELPNLKTLNLKMPLTKSTFKDIVILKLFTLSSTKLEQICYIYPKCNFKSHIHIMQLRAAFRNVYFFNLNKRLFSCSSDAFQSRSKTVVECFKWCSKLFLLNCGITDDQLTLLGEFIVNCTELDTLHLDFNKITFKGATTLSSSLGKCAKLEVFSAHCNQINDSGSLAIGNALFHLKSFKILDLQCNAITEEGKGTLITMAKDCNADIQIYVTSNQNSLLPESNLKFVQKSVDLICKVNMEAVCSALKCSLFVPEVHIQLNANNKTRYVEQKKESITFVCDFSNKDLVTAISFISDGMKHDINLKSLKFNNTKSSRIGSDSLKALAEALKRKCCSNLLTLDLRCGSIGLDGTVAIVGGLSCCINLQTLDLQSNGIGLGGAVALAEALKFCTNLQTLLLGSNGIGSGGTIALAEALKCCTNLQTLSLGFNSIASDGAVALAEGLKYCTYLQTLNLTCNTIGANGAVALAKGLKNCSNLQTLYLGFNNIGSDSAVALAEGLKHCIKLQTLSLSSNSIGSDGAVALAEELEHFTNLQTLYLGSNGIGSDGALALAKRLQHCTNLTELYLIYDNIDTKDKATVCNLLKGVTCYM